MNGKSANRNIGVQMAQLSGQPQDAFAAPQYGFLGVRI
jgi:hypothetical protein